MVVIQLPPVGGAAAGSGGGAKSEAGASGSACSVARTCSSTGSSSETSGESARHGVQENGCVSHGGNWASEVCAVMVIGLAEGDVPEVQLARTVARGQRLAVG